MLVSPEQLIPLICLTSSRWTIVNTSFSSLSVCMLQKSWLKNLEFSGYWQSNAMKVSSAVTKAMSHMCCILNILFQTALLPWLALNICYSALCRVSLLSTCFHSLAIPPHHISFLDERGPWAILFLTLDCIRQVCVNAERTRRYCQIIYYIHECWVWLDLSTIKS